MLHPKLRMDAIELLKQQHEEVRKLFVELENTKDEDDKATIFEELADSLAAHALIEEKIFYPTAYAKSTKELLTEAVEEHLAMKRIITDLLDMSTKDENYDAKVKVLKEQVEHHVQEEEGQLFKKVRKELDEGELEAMGVQMEEMFEQAMDNEPSSKVPEETAHAAPLH